jgi:DNA-binding NarL/FixJ family response regulator
MNVCDEVISTEEEFSASTGADPISKWILWLVDDDASVRGLMAELIEYRASFKSVRQFSSAEAVLAALGNSRGPDVLLMDVNMGGMSGIDAVRPIKRLSGSTRVFIMTTFFDSQRESNAFAAGASGFFLKTDELETVLECIRDPSTVRRLRNGGSAICEPQLSETMAETVDSVQNLAPDRPSSRWAELGGALIARATALFRPMSPRSS